MNITQKLGVAAVSVLVSLMPVVALASPNNTIPGCTLPAPDHGITNEDGTQWISCITKAAWDAAAAAQQHGTDMRTFFWPNTVTDKYGIVYDCGTVDYHLFWGCVDPTSGPGYDTYIRTLGKELVQKGYHAGDFGGRFDGVMKAVR